MSTSEWSPDELRERALVHLRALTGRADAEFHPGQLEAIEALVLGHRRALVVQRTGWGKSAVYFVASLLLRERAGVARPTLIVSPLLALMRDQVAAAERAGVRAATINSGNAEEWSEIAERLAAGELDVLLVSPERLVNPRFEAEQLPLLLGTAGLLVIDEAHCISDWGHDFRPDYRRIRSLIARLPPQFPVLATTATANERVVTDVVEQLAAGLQGEEVFTLRGPLARASLRLGVLALPTPTQRLGWLAAHLGELTGSGIVYALTIAQAEDTAAFLRERGFAVAAYSGRTELGERVRLEEALRTNEVKALVATSALGMGFDKPDLGFVVHLGAPSSPVAYYQQVGRAGRATDSADVLLLPAPEDRDIWHWFATASMPTEQTSRAVLGALDDAGRPLSVPALEARVDLRRNRLELLLKVLAVEGAVEKVSGGWATTGAPWHHDSERYERIAEARRAEQRAMLAYQRTDGCRMEFLARELDDPAAAPCGRCDTCLRALGRPAWFSGEVPDEAVETAAHSLQAAGVEIEPRLTWPSNLDRFGIAARGRLQPGEVAAPGRALGRLSDLGLGGQLRQLFRSDDEGRPLDGPVPEALARACVGVLREWGWQERPVAVVSIPSRSRPELIGSLAAGIARVGRLTDLGPLAVHGPRPDSGARGNSAWRASALWQSFAPTDEQRAALGAGPVLLVDDLVDTGWTMTVAARVLREAGAPAVLPFALAKAG